VWGDDILFKKVSKYLLIGIITVFVLSWISSGFYTVKSGEEAVVLRFGKYSKSVSNAGLNWHIPAPVENVIKINVLEIKRLEFGYKTGKEGAHREYSTYVDVPWSESLMLTGDENLVNVETAVQYKVKDVDDYLFNVKDQTGTLQIAGESAIRRVIANHVLDEVLTENKYEIQQEIKEDLQNICNDYNFGINIIAVQLQDVYPPDEVDAAFKDVANAREDKNSYINEAETYKNEVIPNARGNAAEKINEAMAYKEKRIAEAKGDVANFAQILEKYEQGREVTRIRMYLETMEEVLPGIEKYIVGSDGNLIKFLPLEQNSILKNDVNKGKEAGN
jgi:membrane protease subunit HflK